MSLSWKEGCPKAGATIDPVDETSPHRKLFMTANILVIDDDAVVGKALKRTLEARGYFCTVADHAKEARSLFERGDFNLVLCDIGLGEESGLELLRDLLADRPGTPSLIVTGSDDPKLVDSALDIGAYGYLLKPIDPNQLLIDVANALRRGALDRGNSLSKSRLEEAVQQRTQALRNSQSLYQSLVESLPLNLFSKDKSGNFTFVNKRFCQTVGKPLEAILNTTDFDHFPSSLAEKYRADDQRVIESLQILDQIEEHIVSDGSKHYVHVIKSPVYNFRGEVIGVHGVFSDVTERQLAADALTERSDLMALSAEIGVALARGNTLRSILRGCTEALVKHVGAAFARIWTLNAEETALYLQASSGLYTHTDGGHRRVPVGMFKIGLIAQERLPHLTNSVQTDPRVGDKEWALREGMVSFAGHPILFDDKLLGVMALFSRKALGVATLKALATVADQIALGIVRKQEEEELRRANEETRLAKARMEVINRELQAAHAEEGALLAAISSILIGLDLNGSVTQWNAVAEATFGVSVADAFGKPLAAIEIKWDWASIQQQIDRSLSSESPAQLDDVRYRRRDEKPGFLGLKINPVKDADGSPRGFLLLGSDITQRRILESQLAQAQKLESIGQLAAGIAHEINTPTQYIGDNVRFLKDSVSELGPLLRTANRFLESQSQDTSELLEQLREAGRQCDLGYLIEEIPKAIDQSLQGVGQVARIVRSIKEFAHPGQTEKAASDLNRAIESTAIVAKNEWKYVADLQLDLDPELPSVPVLLGEFNQVILNMIINAAHAIGDVLSKQSDRKGTIRISTRKDGDWAEIRISDTGPGIPEAIRERIFDPFFTTKPVGKGTGQGLAISHSVIVEKHKGSMALESAVGRGATFVLRLPLAER